MNAIATAREAQELGAPKRGTLMFAWATAALQDFEMVEPFVDDVLDQEWPYGLSWVALFLSLNGRPAEAAALANRVLELPEQHENYTTAGVIALLAREHRAAARHLERAYELAPHPVGPNPVYGWSLFLDHATLLGYALLKTGDEDRARRLFDETEQYYADRITRGDTSIRARMGIAAVHALRGDREAAYRRLQQAIDAGFYQYAELERHPCFESLHDEERFRRMMDGVRASVAEVRRRVDALGLLEEPPSADAAEL